MRRKERKRELERSMERKRLDEEMRPFRKAGLDKNPTNGLLRVLRKVLRVPIAEIAEKVGVARSTLFDFEVRELDCSITLRSMCRVADAMDCKMVYGIVPLHGKTMEELVEERYWRRELERRDQGTGIREQGSGVREHWSVKSELLVGDADDAAGVAPGDQQPE
jgi:DNA-binding XRE family transcriptional regulator